jgi:hypothetical protein
VEVWFKPAYAVCLPALLRGLEITRDPNPEADNVTSTLGRSLESWEALFTVRGSGDGGTGWVVAGGVHGRHGRREPHEPQMFDGEGIKPDEHELFSIRIE